MERARLNLREDCLSTQFSSPRGYIPGKTLNSLNQNHQYDNTTWFNMFINQKAKIKNFFISTINRNPPRKNLVLTPRITEKVVYQMKYHL